MTFFAGMNRFDPKLLRQGFGWLRKAFFANNFRDAVGFGFGNNCAVYWSRPILDFALRVASNIIWVARPTYMPGSMQLCLPLFVSDATLLGISNTKPHREIDI